ncbi:hypothetical protein C8R45DRAFT_214896 [Mycena sanguinolenta]|nr:hypothetical protein C8R45DRAFT_214896 [Mycena sanguinolenta]
MHTFSPVSPLFKRSGRWFVAPSSAAGSISASWAGASITFLFKGTILQLQTGPSTERRDRFNGGTPLIACSIESPSGTTTETYNPDGSQLITLFESVLTDDLNQPRIICVTLIDWASIFEVEAFLTPGCGDIEDPRSFQPTPSVEVLVIGDSISCGWTDGSKPIPLGCLDAFPFAMKRDVMHNIGLFVDLDLIAYPAITLVDPTEEEADAGGMLGMVSKFEHTSPWSSALLEELPSQRKPSLVVIALGTNDEAQDISPTRFAAAFHTLLSNLFPRYGPSIKHVCLLPPFVDLNDSDHGEEETIASCFSSVVAALPKSLPTASPDCVFHEITLGVQLQTEETIDGLHPNVAGHQLLGSALSKQIVPLLRSCIGPSPRDV